MENTDKLLLEYYMLGFNDELHGTSSIVPDDNHLYLKAYNLGAFHAISGDDQTSLDYLTGEEIIDRIKRF